MDKKEHWWETKEVEVPPEELTESQKRLRVKEWLIALIEEDMTKVFSDTFIGVRMPINLPFLKDEEQMQLFSILRSKAKKEDSELEYLKKTLAEDKILRENADRSKDL